jgi:hypothetical protein
VTTTPGERRRRALHRSPRDAHSGTRDDAHSDTQDDARVDDAAVAQPQEPAVAQVPAPPAPREAAPQPPPSVDAAPPPDAPADRPLSRRELRERERSRTVAPTQQRSPAAPSPVVASLAALVRRVPSRVSPAGRAVGRDPSPPGGPGGAGVVPHPPPEHEDLAPHEPYRYTWKHLGVLVAVAGVLGLLIWSQTTADGSGADGARAADTTSSSTTTRGEP